MFCHLHYPSCHVSFYHLFSNLSALFKTFLYPIFIFSLILFCLAIYSSFSTHLYLPCYLFCNIIFSFKIFPYPISILSISSYALLSLLPYFPVSFFLGHCFPIFITLKTIPHPISILSLSCYALLSLLYFFIRLYHPCYLLSYLSPSLKTFPDLFPFYLFFVIPCYSSTLCFHVFLLSTLFPSF